MIRAVTLVLLLGQVPARVESLWKVGDALELDAPATLVTLDRAGIHPGKTLPRGTKREVIKVRKVAGVSYLLVYDGWLEGRKLRLRGRAEPEEETDERFRVPEGGWKTTGRAVLAPPAWSGSGSPAYQPAPRATPTFQQRLDAAAAEGLPDPKDREEKAPAAEDPAIKIPRLGIAPSARTGGSTSSADSAQGRDPIHVDGHYDSRGRYVREHYRARSGEANGSQGSGLDGN